MLELLDKLNVRYGNEQLTSVATGLKSMVLVASIMIDVPAGDGRLQNSATRYRVDGVGGTNNRRGILRIRTTAQFNDL